MKYVIEMKGNTEQEWHVVGLMEVNTPDEAERRIGNMNRGSRKFQYSLQGVGVEVDNEKEKEGRFMNRPYKRRKEPGHDDDQGNYFDQEFR